MGYIQTDAYGNIISVTGTKIKGTSQISINDEALIENIKNNITDYKWNGSQVIHVPRTSAYHEWNGTEWIFSEQLKQDAQNYIWEKIMEYRDEKYTKGCKVGDYWFHTDVDSKLKYLGLLAFGDNLPEDLYWKTMTGEMVLMTVELLQNVFITVSTHEATIFATGEYHRGNLMASSDPLNYDYTTGWTATYS